MITLPELKTKLSERASRRSSLLITAGKLTLNEDARLCANDSEFELTTEGRNSLARHASIPCDFFEKCPPDTQSFLFNRFHKPEILGSRWDEPVTLVLEDAIRVLGIVNAGLALLTGQEVLDIVLAQRPSHVGTSSLDVSSVSLNGHVRVSIVTQRINTQPQVGDTVYGGIDILHSETADVGTSINSFFVRLVCRNGMLVKTCTHGEKASRRIRRATESNCDLTRARIAEMAHRAWHELDAKIQALRELPQQPVDDVPKLLESIGERYRFPADLIREIVAAAQHDELASSSSLWDLVNALSRVGTHADHLSEARQRYLQELSGELINDRVPQCPTCGRVLPRRMRLLPRR